MSHRDHEWSPCADRDDDDDVMVMTMTMMMMIMMMMRMMMMTVLTAGAAAGTGADSQDGICLDEVVGIEFGVRKGIGVEAKV